MQLFESVIVQQYSPEHKSIIEFPVERLLHKYEYGGYSPLTVSVAVPSQSPLQVIFVCETETIIAAGCVIVTQVVIVQLFESVIVQQYVPEHKFIIESL